MPWDPKYRKQGVHGVTANAIDVVVETGDSGPMTPVGINLPNDQAIREQHGSKSVSLANVNEAYDKSHAAGVPAASSRGRRKRRTRAEKWSALAGELTTDHARSDRPRLRQGRRAPGGQPAARAEGAVLGARRVARRSGRAVFPARSASSSSSGSSTPSDHDEIVRAEYEGYARNALVQLRRVREGTQIEEDHMRNRQMIVHWLMAHSTAIEVRKRDGKTYYVMVDAAGVPRRRRPAAGRSAAHQVRRRLRGGAGAVRDLRRPLRSGAARRSRRARGRAAAAVLYRLRAAEAGSR